MEKSTEKEDKLIEKKLLQIVVEIMDEKKLIAKKLSVSKKNYQDLKKLTVFAQIIMQYLMKKNGDKNIGQRIKELSIPDSPKYNNSFFHSIADICEKMEYKKHLKFLIT